MPVGGKANGGQGRWEAGGRRGWVLLSGHLSPWRCCPGGRTGPQAAGGSSAEEAEARAGAEPKQTSGPRWPPPSPTCHLAPGWGPRGQRLWHRPLLNRHPDPPALSPAGCGLRASCRPSPQPSPPCLLGSPAPTHPEPQHRGGGTQPTGGRGRRHRAQEGTLCLLSQLFFWAGSPSRPWPPAADPQGTKAGRCYRGMAVRVGEGAGAAVLPVRGEGSVAPSRLGDRPDCPWSVELPSLKCTLCGVSPASG